MSLAPEHRKALQALARRHAKAELKALFAAIRTHSDKALLAAAKPAAKKKPVRRDALVGDIEAKLRPLLGPASEKADLLLEFVERKHGVSLDFEPRGLADAVRRLRKHVSDADIRSAAKGLMAEVAERYSKRETVV